MNINQIIDSKLNNDEILTFKEQNFYFEITKREFKQQLIVHPSLKDVFFLTIYNIYLTDTYNSINEMSKSHSDGITIRELYGIDFTPKQILDFLKNISEDFKLEILKNNNLFKENNALKNAIKKEFKTTENEINKDKEDIENNVFETILYSKKIYLNLLEENLENKIIVFCDQTFELNITFYVHIIFGHYYQMLKKTKLYIEKDHFEKHKFNEWKEILSKLSVKFNEEDHNIENTNVINFRLDGEFYRLALNMKKNVLISLFPLNNEEIIKLDLNKIIEL